MQPILRFVQECLRSSAIYYLILLQLLPTLGFAEEPQGRQSSLVSGRERSIDFESEIVPLFRQHCLRCHGPKAQEGGFRLDKRQSVFSTADSGEALIVPGAADQSLLVLRVTDESHGDLMPLDSSALDQKSIQLLKRWINEGAEWTGNSQQVEHWAYRSLSRPIVPAPIDFPQSGCDAENAVDRFLQAAMQTRQMRPSPKADRRRIIRRVSLALTGVPPSREEVYSFLMDTSPGAYERVVDRLLQSPRFGEFWSIPWLDLARYADSNGFQADQLRDNWAYRDWVIRAMNSDLPFDQFVVDQLAGDLIEDATRDQLIATGFHRMTTCNVEAGVDPEANRVNQIVDRVNTTATVFMGTTLECAQCHDHKYDPFTQRDYYRLFAYFNNTPLEVENTSGVTWDFYGPKMELPLPADVDAHRSKLNRQLAEARKERKQFASGLDLQFEEWLAELRQTAEVDLDWRKASPSSFVSSGGEESQIQNDGSVLLTGTVPDTTEYTLIFLGPTKPITAIRLDALTDESLPGSGPGRGDESRTNFIVSEFRADLHTSCDHEQLAFRSAVADFSQSGWSVSQAIDGDPKTGWAIAPKFGQTHWAAFLLEQPFELEDGQQLKITIEQNYGRGRVVGKPRISFLHASPRSLDVDRSIAKIARNSKLSEEDLAKLRGSFEAEQPTLQDLDAEIEHLQSELETMAPSTTLVMVENEHPRETFVMLRGNYEQRGEQVQPGIPEVFSKDDQPVLESANNDRLALANWLTCNENPLLPRVTVNRWWAGIFGRALVDTPEDFGTQAALPTHPALLDWLACELVESDWSMKHVLKKMVMSHAFQQEAVADRDSQAIDPDNRWLARGPRFRMSAEGIRDHGLAVSGLLTTPMYGPPVMPFQPEKIWRSVGRNQPKWQSAENADRFRRGVYVVCKRAAPYPSFVNFDAPDRSSCSVRRNSTNTPLQALTLLNDPAFAEMFLALAERILLECPSQDQEDRIRYAFELVLSRLPSSFEIAMISDLLATEKQQMSDEEVRGRTQTLVPSMMIRADDRRELAAWFAVANVLLNLDEAMSR